MPAPGAPAKGSGALHSRPIGRPTFRHKKPRERGVLERDGAETRNRTADLLITNQLLYRLSYFGFEGANPNDASEQAQDNLGLGS